MADDVIFHKLNSILETLATVQLNGTKSPNDFMYLLLRDEGSKAHSKRVEGSKAHSK